MRPYVICLVLTVTAVVFITIPNIFITKQHSKWAALKDGNNITENDKVESGICLL